MAISAKTKKAIEARKQEALNDENLVNASKATMDRKEGNGLVSVLPAGKYILSDMEYIDDEYQYVLCTFLNQDEKEFKISQSTCLKPIYDAAGENINQFSAFGVDHIGEEFDITHADNFGFRAMYDASGSFVPAGKTGHSFYYEPTGEQLKGRKTIVMVCEL